MDGSGGGEGGGAAGGGADGDSYITAPHKPAALLPIARHRDAILYTVETHRVVIVVGQTGSGKTTQIPQFLHRAGWTDGGRGIIAVTQPRRVAAVSVAARVAEEMGCQVGEEVGYSIRFEDLTSAKTRIKFMTDGMLLREALVDPLLSRYSVIMVDEAHERSLSTEVLLGVLKKIMRRRSELKIIVSSATLQAEEFAAYFDQGQQGDRSNENKTDNDNGTNNKSSNDDSSSNSNKDSNIDSKNDTNINSRTSSIISLSGRSFPVDLLYLEEPTENYIEKAIETIFRIHASEGQGDILVFLTGRDEIEKAVGEVRERSQQLPQNGNTIMSLPLYAGLTVEQQNYVFEATPSGFRKVIVATNIAEASVTIDGIKFVIDCGFVKLRAFNPASGIETLTAVPISKASATQRAGRAGRTKAGKCFRLYTEEDFRRLPATSTPEIQRSNLAPLILQLKALGIDNINRFDFFTSPPAELITKGLELLYSLGALDEYAKLSRPLGTRMAEIAVEPMMAKVLLSAGNFKCLGEMLSIAAMTSLQGTVWFSHDGERKSAESARHRFAAEEGDHLTLLNAYHAFVTKGKRDAKWCRDNRLNHKSMVRAVAIRAQLRRYLEKFGVSVLDDDISGFASGATKTFGDAETGERIRRCLTTGFFAYAARMQPDGTFRPVGGNLILHAHPSSMMFNRKADWVIFHEIMESGDKTYIRDISKIEKSWLLEYAADYYQVK